eukprot:TRINITY_DN3597_c0_g1_i1.p1 TRINITY_DN3597_c0_g1~~TRINITY_DN3597_c0_g1_i1.p1  ORF type:complete len:1492 (+),score=392.40 TRINITY_DN3597_c0_g1_i1:126-4601(+)
MGLEEYGVYVVWLEDEDSHEEVCSEFRVREGAGRVMPFYAVVSLRWVASEINWTWALHCSNLIYLDISGNNLTSLSPGVWRTMPNLRVLLLHENSLPAVEELTCLADKMPGLVVATFYGNPVVSYRRKLATALPSLVMIDDYVVADTERIDYSRNAVSDVFEPLNACLKVPLNTLMPAYARHVKDVRDREARVLGAITALLAHVKLVASRFSPSVQIQKLWRGRSARKDWGMYVLDAQLRVKEKAESNVMSPKTPAIGAFTMSELVPGYDTSEGKFKINRAVVKIQCHWRRRLAFYEVVKLASAQRRVGNVVYVPPNQVPQALNILKQHSRLKEDDLCQVTPCNIVMLRMHSVGGREAKVSGGRIEHRSLHTLLLDRSRAVFRRPARQRLPDVSAKWCMSRKYLRKTVSREAADALRHEVRSRLVWVASPEPLTLVRLEVHNEVVPWFMKKVHSYNHGQQLAPLSYYMEQDMRRLVGAVDIQRVWRGYTTRKPLVARGLIGKARALSFCVVQIQALCRRLLAQRRHCFLRSMKLLIASASVAPPPLPAHVAEAWGLTDEHPSTEVFLSFNAYRQLIFAWDHGARVHYDVSMTTLPDQRRLIPELFTIATAVSLASAAKGDSVVFYGRLLQELPAWLVGLGKLRSNLLPSLTPTHNYPTKVSLRELLMGGALIPRALIPSSRHYFKCVENPDLRILEHFGRGYVCLRYGSREEAMRRRLLLAALTYHSPTRSYICFEHPRSIVRHEAACEIQNWYLHCRLAQVPPVTGSAVAGSAVAHDGYPRPDATLPTPHPLPGQDAPYLPPRPQSVPRPTPSPLLMDSVNGDWSGVSHSASRPGSSLLDQLSPRTRRLLQKQHRTDPENFGVSPGDDSQRSGVPYVSPAVVADVIRDRPTVRVVREVVPRQPANFSFAPAPPGTGYGAEVLDETYNRAAFSQTLSAHDLDDEMLDSMELIGARPRPPALNMQAVAEQERLVAMQEKAELKAHLRQKQEGELAIRRAKVQAARHARQQLGGQLVSEGCADGSGPTALSGTGLDGALKVNVGRGVPKKVQFNLAQLKLSATLQQFAGQAGDIEREGWANGSETADLHVTPADLKWMTSRELSTLAAAKTARAAVQAKADVALRRYSNLQSRIVMQEKRNTAQRSRATSAEAYRVKYNAKLYQQWQDDKTASSELRKRRDDASDKAQQMQSQRAAVALFHRQQNVLGKETFQRSLDMKRSHEHAENARAIYQARLEASEAKQRITNWTEAELKLRRAVYAYGVLQQKRALDERVEEERVQVQSMREEQQAKGDSKRHELLEKFEAVPPTSGEFTRVRAHTSDLPPRPVKVQTLPLVVDATPTPPPPRAEAAHERETLAIHVFPREGDIPRHPASRVRPGTALVRGPKGLEHTAGPAASAPRGAMHRAPQTARAAGPRLTTTPPRRPPTARRPHTARAAKGQTRAIAIPQALTIPQAVILTPPTAPPSRVQSARQSLDVQGAAVGTPSEPLVT